MSWELYATTSQNQYAVVLARAFERDNPNYKARVAPASKRGYWKVEIMKAAWN